MNGPSQSAVTIVSGGQTGVDRAALDAALAAGVAVGGWCPEGRLAEDGPIDEKYPLKELEGGGYPERTRQNVVDSNGTAIIYFDQISNGTKLTYNYCISESRPNLLVDGVKIDIPGAVKLLDQFVRDNEIMVLNVAGPRASKDDRGYEYTRRLIDGFLNLISR